MALSPLKLRKSDFQREGKYAEMNRLYRLWFEMLGLSPSYELARRYRDSNGLLSVEDQARLPKDFENVLAVYDDFGDVNHSFFRLWWLERGLNLMGSLGKPPQVKALAKIQKDHADIKTVTHSIKQHLQGEWLDQNQPSSLVLSVPLNQTRETILKQVKQLLDQHIEPKHVPKPAKYKLEAKHIQVQNVVDAMQVLWIRAAKPDWELWKVGVESKVSEKLSGKFNVKTTKRTDNNFDDLRNLESVTSRKYKIARNIVENAARGVFPSQLPCEYAVAFDPYEFRKILGDRRQWMMREAPKQLTLAREIK
jgi:hypothetical protein